MDLDQYIDLATERLGGAAILTNDEFFAPKDRLVNANEPVWKEGLYDEHGKWMDGWETRRRRTPGYDWCIVRLGLAGAIKGLVVDTAFFTGNYPEECSVEACAIEGPLDLQAVESAQWFELLPKSQLKGNTKNVFDVSSEQRVTHLRLNIFPDGGVARLRAHGVVLPDWERLRRRGEIDLAAIENGGVVLSCSDMHYGNRQNLIMPGSATHMGDGWETKRRRKPGNEWSIIRLGARGTIDRMFVDTTHFKGNAPDRCTLELIDSQADPTDKSKWTTVLDHKLQPHTRHAFDLGDTVAATHARFSIFPDGGVGRLRLFGKPV